MNDNNVRLPRLRDSEPPKPQLFAPGSRVLLASCPSGEPGVVQGTKYGRIIVHWPSLRFTGKHRPDALIRVTQEATPESGQ
jgi:hypothetical protein